MKLYSCHLTYHGLDLLLTVDEEGRHWAATRPGMSERWTTWSPPVELIAESAAVSE